MSCQYDYTLRWLQTSAEGELYGMIKELNQAGDTRIPLPRKSLGHPQEIVDCQVGLRTSLRTVAEFL